MSWSNGRIESLPCLEADAEVERLLIGVLEEPTVPAYHDSRPIRSVGVRSKDEVERGDDGKDVVVAVVGLACKVT